MLHYLFALEEDGSEFLKQTFRLRTPSRRHLVCNLTPSDLVTIKRSGLHGKRHSAFYIRKFDKNFGSSNFCQKMKLSLSLLAASTVTAWQKKEWEVQDAYFADEEIILSDPTTRKVFDPCTKQRYK